MVACDVLWLALGNCQPGSPGFSAVGGIRPVLQHGLTMNNTPDFVSHPIGTCGRRPQVPIGWYGAARMTRRKRRA